MGELAVLGVFLGLWRALSSGVDAGLRRDNLESSFGWLLVAVSVLLAITAAFPASLTDTTVASCSRTGTCGNQPRADDVVTNRPSVTRGPGAPLPMQLTG